MLIIQVKTSFNTLRRWGCSCVLLIVVSHVWHSSQVILMYPEYLNAPQWMVENRLGLLQATEISGTVSAVRQEWHRDIAKHYGRPLGVLETLSGWHLITSYRLRPYLLCSLHVNKGCLSKPTARENLSIQAVMCLRKRAAAVSQGKSDSSLVCMPGQEKGHISARHQSKGGGGVLLTWFIN